MTVIMLIFLGAVATFTVLYTVAYVKARGTGTGPNSRERVAETVVAVVKKG